MSAAYQESLWVCARCWYESLLISRYGRVAIHVEFGEAADLDLDRLVAYKRRREPIRMENHTGLCGGFKSSQARCSYTLASDVAEQASHVVTKEEAFCRGVKNSLLQSRKPGKNGGFPVGSGGKTGREGNHQK